MIKKLITFSLILFSTSILASENGIFLKTHQAIKEDINVVQTKISEALLANGFDVLYKGDVNTPDYVRENKSEHCGFKAKLIVFSSKTYLDILTKEENKYLTSAYCKTGSP